MESGAYRSGARDRGLRDIRSSWPPCCTWLSTMGSRSRLSSSNAGLGPDVTPHVLRHSCATLMLQNRVSTWDVARVLGRLSFATLMATIALSISGPRSMCVPDAELRPLTAKTGVRVPLGSATSFAQSFTFRTLVTCLCTKDAMFV
jgi:hypothetical protein